MLSPKKVMRRRSSDCRLSSGLQLFSFSDQKPEGAWSVVNPDDVGEHVRLNMAGSEAIKVSRRDLAYCLSQKLNGATTVSGTMVLAHLAGIRVFATGGIGGVHKGGQSSMDISADLTELGRTPVAVVCAGIKSILDIPRCVGCRRCYRES